MTVAVNLYPFEATVARPGTTLPEAIEQIDIGGVALLRAAAKNFEHVAVLTHPSQYAEYVRAIETDEEAAALRRRLAIAAFERTAEYDAAISHYLATAGEVLPSELPGALALTLPLAKRLRYGTNPQERAAFYLDRADRLPEQLGGKALSYNNLLDLDATLRLLSRAPLGAEFGSEHGRFVRAAVVKHAVPCGVAQRSRVGLAVREALDADPMSAYGGIVAADAPLDRDAAAALREFFLEIVAAPDFDADALEILRKKKNLRIMRFAPSLPDELARELRLRSALGRRLSGRRRSIRASRAVARRQPCAPDETTVARPRVCVGRGAARQEQWHRDCQGWDHAGNLRRADQPRQRGARSRRAARANGRAARPALATVSSRLRTGWRQPSSEVALRSSRRAAPCATKK